MDQESKPEIDQKERNRKIMYFVLGIAHPVIYTLRNRTFLYDPAFRSFFLKEIGMRSVLCIGVAQGFKYGYEWYLLSQFEKQQAIENLPQNQIKKSVEKGEATKLKNDDPLNYILSGRIRE
ncbi:unnamed protein product [Moneuplotes crassus]|uniref:Uncharacterized protein n=2 Tax=Euplotes crassus TaxID=5936 RepID=A0AAD1Y6M6_EUPCR|nr:unnamed protein product [Moneuplotes crassus]